MGRSLPQHAREARQIPAGCPCVGEQDLGTRLLERFYQARQVCTGAVLTHSTDMLRKRDSVKALDAAVAMAHLLRLAGRNEVRQDVPRPEVG